MVLYFFFYYLSSLGFYFNTDSSIFIYNNGGTPIFLLLYVDDILITGNSNSTINTLIAQLNSMFHIKNVGFASIFLGIQFYTHLVAFFFINNNMLLSSL